jgi:transposase
MFQYRQVLARLRAGDSERDIARSKLMGRQKLAALRVLAAEHGWLDPARELPDEAALAAAVGAGRRASSTVSSVEPWRELVAQWQAAGVQGKAIHAALRRQYGYSGSYSSVARMLVALRGVQPPEVTVRLSFEPGEAAQVDFGAGPVLMHPDGRPRRTWAFVMTLCSSRHQYVEFVWDQTVATWLGCHRRAFEWFAGVPARLIIDNAKCAITKACAKDPLVQRAYAECAEGYGFKIDACPPHDPQKKGIVEAGVKYLKGNFLPTRSFRDLADLNAQARAWLLDEAGVRVHGTTRAKPLALFELERVHLKPLPAVAPDLGTWHRVAVHRDCHVQFERVLYSAPFTLAGKTLWLRATDAAVALYDELRHVVTHPRGRRPGERLTVRDHLPPQAQAFFAHDRAWCVGAGRTGGTGVPAVDRAPAGRPHRRAVARGARRHQPGQAVRLRAAGGGLPTGAGARVAVLPHRQDHPGHRRRPARRADPGDPAGLRPLALRARRGQPVRSPAARAAALKKEKTHEPRS